jgi:hypothetical protein
MTIEPHWKDLNTQLRIYTIWALSGVIDSVFLVVWVFTTWFVDEKIVAYFQVYGIDKWVLSTFQILFSLSTLAPIVIYIVGDISRMVIQARRKLQLELDKAKIVRRGKN